VDSSGTSSGTVPVVSPRSPSSEMAEASIWARFGLFVLALAGGLSIFVFGSPFFDIFPTNDSVPYGLALVALFGAISFALGLRPSLTLYSSCVYALFVAAVANLILTIGPFNWLITSSETYQEFAQDKLAQFLAVVPVILLLTWVRRRPLASIYLQVGRPRRWVGLGLPWLALGTLGIIGIAYAYDIDAETFLAAVPWILVFVALNATMEELWFRAIFLRPYSTAMGSGLAILVTALIFGIAHVNAEYMSPGEVWAFGIGVFIIGLVAAWAMRWANSLWGSVLFHMGIDLLIIIQIAESG
jgi:membrane protease YdiL (CAAX protease family)